jgi:hypothetical protein
MAYTEPWRPCTCSEGCQEHAHITLVDEGGDAFEVRVPWDSRYDSAGWHGRARVRWTGEDGVDRHGLEVGRGRHGVTALDGHGERHRIPHGIYRSVNGTVRMSLAEQIGLFAKERIKGYIRRSKRGLVQVHEHQRGHARGSNPEAQWKVAALYVDPKGPYRDLVSEWYDEKRDARTYRGPLPVVAHPPCGPWGKLAWKTKGQSKEAGIHAVEMVRKFGGVLEHPVGSRLFETMGIPTGNWEQRERRTDEYGGYTIKIRQWDLGHRAEKETILYIVGTEYVPMLLAAQQMGGEERRVPVEHMTHLERRLTPAALALALAATASYARPGGTPANSSVRPKIVKPWETVTWDEPMEKARAPLKAGQRWITVHPNGPDEEGVPILIEPNPDGTHSVVAGAGGKLQHLRLTGIKSKEEYAEEGKKKAEEKRAKEKERKARQTPEEAEIEEKSKAEVKEEKLLAERAFIQRVREKMGGVREDLAEEKTAGLSQGAKNTILSRHHRKQLRDAQDRVKQASEKLVDEHAQRLKEREKLGEAMREDPVLHEEAAAQAEMELDLRGQEEEERKRERQERKQRQTTGQTKVSEKAAEKTKAAIAEAEDPANELDRLGGRDDDPSRPLLQIDNRPSEELERRSLQKLADAKVLQAVAEKGKAETDLEKRVVSQALKLNGEDETGDLSQQGELIQAEAARALRRSEVLHARSEAMANVEEDPDAGGLEKAVRQLAFTDVITGIAKETAVAKRLGLTEADRTPLKEAEIEAFKDVLKDAKELREKTAQFKAMNKAAETGEYEKARSAFKVSTSEKLDQKVEDDIEDEVRRNLAESIRGLADRKRSDFANAHAAGSYDVMADISLGIAGQRYLDRAVVNALGPANAAVVLRHALEGDGHLRARVLRALETQHVQSQTKIAQDAIDKAEKYVPGLSHTVESVGDIETALANVDAHHQDIQDAQAAVGAALGRLETMALVGQAFRQNQPDNLTIHGKDMNTTLAWLHSIGLTEAGKDYALDHESKTATIPREAWGKLISKVPREELATRQEALAIKGGEQDERGWLPKGIVKREASTFTAASPVAPRLYQDLDLRGKPLGEALEDHVGSRLAEGEQAHDIMHDLLSPALTAQAPDKAAYVEAVKGLFPLQDAEGKRRKYEDSAAHFEGLASKWAEKQGVDGAFHAQDLHVEDPATREALFRTQADYQHTATAFTPTGQLTHQQQSAIRDHFYSTMGIDPKSKADEAKFEAEFAALGPEPDPTKGTMSLFGGGGPTPEYRDWVRKRDEILKRYPRAGLQEAIKAAKGDETQIEAAKQEARKQKTAWDHYVEAHGSLELAQRAIQDEMKHEAVQKFADHYGKLTGRAVRKGVVEVTNRERHLKATATAEEAEKMKADQMALQAGLRERMGGKFAAEGEGAVREKFTKFLEQETIDKQNQLGMFGAAKGREAALPKLKEPGRGERWSIGARAEAQIASLVPDVTRQFEGKGVKLLSGLDMDQGDRIHQQRAVKMMRKVRRMGIYLGTGSGKSLVSIGSFTDAHEDGEATHGLYVVPSAVQQQFGGEMLRFTEPGKYRWATGAEKGHDERVAMLKDPSLHMKVFTHESFAQTVAQLMADHHTGGDLDAMKEKLRTAKASERAEMLRDVREKHGIAPWFYVGDEAQKFTTREEIGHLTNLIMGAASHPLNTTHCLLASATPHKNDENEVFSMAALIDPDKYADRHGFMQTYGTELGQRPDAIRREFAHNTYSARVLPEGVTRTDSDNPRIVDGQKVPGDGPIKLEGEHKAGVDRVLDAYDRAKRAEAQGKVDVDAVKVITPKRFEGQPEDQHEAIAKAALRHLGLTKEKAIRRAINQRKAEDGNQKLQQLCDVVEHDLKHGTWTDRKGQVQRGKPCIIFTDSAEEMKLIHETLVKRGIRSATYHGGLTGKQKEAVRLGYQPPPGQEPIYDVIVMTSAGEAGLNIQRAKVVHNYDVPMTEKSHAQRAGRAHRQGQEGDVEIHNWHTDADFEQAARRRLRRKEGLASVFETPLGNVDELGIAEAYHKELAEEHQASLNEAA